MSDPSPSSRLEQIWSSGSIQIVLSYLVGAWGLIQFVDWLVQRYSSSTHWTDGMVVFLLGMLPAVLIYASYRAKGKVDGWKKIESIVVPVNLLFSLLLGGLVLFSGGKAKAQTAANTVIVTNEDGVEEKRVAATASQSIRIVNFPTIVDGLSADKQWLRFYIGHLLAADLGQDIRIDCTFPLSLKKEFERHSFDLTTDNPGTVFLRETGNYYSAAYVIRSYLDSLESGYQLRIDIFNTNEKTPPNQLSFIGADYLDLVDQAKIEVISNLNIPEVDVEMEDIPVREHYSANRAAAKVYFEGRLLRSDNQEEAAIEAFNKALTIDPNFVQAWVSIHNAYKAVGNDTAADQAIEEAMARVSSAPERTQFGIKSAYYAHKGQHDKRMALYKMWKKLYPQDLRPYSYLIDYHQSGLEHEKAIQVAEEARQNGHRGGFLLRLAYLYSRAGRKDEAVAAYNDYLEAFPSRVQEATNLGYILWRDADFEAAKEHFDEINTYNPTNIYPLVGLSTVAFSQGAFQQSLDYLDEALSYCKVPQDSSWIYRHLEETYYSLGQADQAIELQTKRFTQIEPSYLTEYKLLDELFYPNTYMLYADAGRTREIYGRCQDFLKQYNIRDSRLSCIADIMLWLVSRPEDNTKTEIAPMCLETFKGQATGREGSLAEAFIAQSENRHADAIALFEPVVEHSREDFFTVALAQSYRATGQAQKGIDLLQRPLKHMPYSGKLLLELAHCQQANGDTGEALTTIDRIQEVWKNADDSFRPLKDALALQAEIQAGL